MPFDLTYLLIVGPFMILGLIAQVMVKSAYHKGMQYANARGLTGAQVARSMLDRNGMTDVAIETSPGELSDHYDPRAKVVRLSPNVHSGRSLASLAIAAHEVGHAIQDKTAYAFLSIRNAAVPLANFGSNAAFMIFFVGLILQASSPVVGQWIMTAAIALFAGVVFFQVVNLPVEFDASKRAKAILVGDGYIAQEELPVVRKVLGAAAMTYVAATLTAVATLLYFILKAQGSRRE